MVARNARIVMLSPHDREKVHMKGSGTSVGEQAVCGLLDGGQGDEWEHTSPSSRESVIRQESGNVGRLTLSFRGEGGAPLTARLRQRQVVSVPFVSGVNGEGCGCRVGGRGGFRYMVHYSVLCPWARPKEVQKLVFSSSRIIASEVDLLEADPFKVVKDGRIVDEE
ncbi:hypothetical protein VNO78_01992 [Psophocarpus tetragonolobus]|uniref:Uncharacterized protein n=1 Tax=Psophocarpus tetragonolobus TaxID=3891 RepID=A0AAN9T017_PSOTE